MEQVVQSAELDQIEFCKILDNVIELLGMKIVEETGYGDDEVKLVKQDYKLNEDH